MNLQKPIIAIALLGITATAHAGLTASIPEPTTVTLIFIALAALGTAIGHKRPELEAIEPESGPTRSIAVSGRRWPQISTRL